MRPNRTEKVVGAYLTLAAPESSITFLGVLSRCYVLLRS